MSSSWLLVASFSLLAWTAPGCALAERPPLSPERGLSYDAFYLPFDLSLNQVRDELSAYQRLGATRIYFTCTEADLERDHKIQVVLTAAHELGLEVFAGPYFAGVFSGDEGGTASLYLTLHPGDREVSRRGQKTETPAYNSPLLRGYLKEQLRRLLAYDFDGLLIDEPRFPEPTEPGDYFPYDDISQTTFMSQFGHPMPDAEESTIEQFRQTSMLAFVRELTDYAKSLRPSLRLALAVLPVVDPSAPDRRGTGDWRALAEIATLDSLHTDPYWPSWGQGFQLFADNLERLQRAVVRPGTTAGIWVQAYSLSEADSATVSEGLLHARKQGVPSINAWLSEHFPNRDNAEVLEQILDGFKP